MSDTNNSKKTVKEIVAKFSRQAPDKIQETRSAPKKAEESRAAPKKSPPKK